MLIPKDATSRSVELYIVDSSDGTPELGVLFDTSGIDLNYRRDGAAVVSITEVTLAALTTAWASGGFKEVANGRYRLDVPDAAFATGVDQVTIGGTVTGMIVLPLTVQLTGFDMGAATVPAILADSASHGGASAVITADVTGNITGNLSGTVGSVTGAVGSVTGAVGSVAGNVDGNVTGDVSGSVTLADGAHGGTAAVLTLERVVVASTTATEPAIKATGNTTGAGMLLTGGVSGAGLSCNGGATTGDGLECVAAGSGVEIDADITGNTTGNLSGSVGSVTGAVGSVTGAVGSVTGSVGSVAGNVGGSTASVTGAVGSVTAGVTLDDTATSAQLVDDVWDEVLTGATHNVATSAGRRLRQLEAAFQVHAGTAQAGSTSTTIVLDAGASAIDNIYRGDRVVIVGGTGAQEHGIIVSYDGGTVTATMAETWVVTPDNTSEFEVVPATVDVETIQHVVQTAGDLAALLATAQVDLDTLTDDDVPGLIAALNNISAANVNAEVLDVMNTDTLTLPGQTAPSNTPTHRAAIALLYKLARNKTDQTATLFRLYDDAGTTVDTKSTVSDDATTAVKGELVTGP